MASDTNPRGPDWSPYLEGSPSPLQGDKLPSKQDILLDHFYQKKSNPSYNTSFKDVKDTTIDRLIEIYGTVPQSVISRKGVELKFKELLAKFTEVKKSALTSKKVNEFKKEMKTIFDISACKCVMKKEFTNDLMCCLCPPDKRIHKKEYDFMFDQRGKRRMVIGNKIDDKTTRKYQDTQHRRERQPPNSDTRSKSLLNTHNIVEPLHNR